MRFHVSNTTIVTIMCRNDELSSTISCVGCLVSTTRFRPFILFAENSSQILLKIYSHSLNFHVSGSKKPTQLIVQLNSSLRPLIDSNNCPVLTPRLLLTYK